MQIPFGTKFISKQITAWGQTRRFYRVREMSAYLLVAAYFQKMAERRDGLRGDILRLPLAKIAIPNKLFVDILRLIALLRQSPDPEAA